MNDHHRRKHHRHRMIDPMMLRWIKIALQTPMPAPAQAKPVVLSV